MTSLPPPTYYFNGIYFNPAFYNPSSLGLTTSTANALYLRKTYADTATAQETFSGGILTTLVNASTGTLTIGNNDPLNIGFGNSRAGAVINLGAGTGNVNIANNISSTVRMGTSTDGINFQFDNMNIINPINNYSFMNAQTSGILNIGNGARTATGSINIGSGSGATANPITIGGASSALTLNGGAITIGNGFGTTSLNGTTTIANLAINNVDRAPASSGALTIASTNATSLVLGNATTCNTSNLGTFTSTGIITANSGISTGSVDPTAAGAIFSLASGQTAGVLNIGTGNRSIAGAIHIGDGSGATAVPITIGGSGSLTTIGGGLTVNGVLSMGTGKAITLQSTTGYVGPVSGQLGYRSAISLSATTATGGAAGLSGFPTDLANFTLPVGVFIIEAYSQINTASLTYDWTFSNASATLGNTAGGYVGAASGTQRTTFVISNSTSATWYWGARSNVSSVAYAYMSIYLTRIA